MVRAAASLDPHPTISSYGTSRRDTGDRVAQAVAVWAVDATG